MIDRTSHTDAERDAREKPEMPAEDLQPHYWAAEDRYDGSPVPLRRQQRPAAAGHLAGPVAQLRRRHALRAPARHHPPRLRPGHHPVRPGQQLRPALRLRRGELRAHLRQGPRALPRRAGHHHQGRLAHVVRPVRLERLAQARPRPASRHSLDAHGPRPRRHLLLAPHRPRHARSRRRWARWPRPCTRARPATSGISSYSPARTAEAARILRELGTPLLIHQPNYSMFNRWIEAELLDVLDDDGAGCIPFSPLAQGLLTDKYLDGVPEGSRGPRRASPSRATSSARRTSPASARSTRSPGAAASPSRRWPSCGCCAIRASATALIGASSTSPARGQRGRARRCALQRRGAGRDRPLRDSPAIRRRPVVRVSRALTPRGARYGASVPANTCQARIVLAKRLMNMYVFSPTR